MKLKWTLTSKAKIIELSTGDRIEAELPEGTKAVIVCINAGGLKPLFYCAPDQIYVSKIKQELRSGRYKNPVAISLIPVKGENRVEIAYF